jgi:hypothetical protein
MRWCGLCREAEYSPLNTGCGKPADASSNLATKHVIQSTASSFSMQCVCAGSNTPEGCLKQQPHKTLEHNGPELQQGAVRGNTSQDTAGDLFDSIEARLGQSLQRSVSTLNQKQPCLRTNIQSGMMERIRYTITHCGMVEHTQPDHAYMQSCSNDAESQATANSRYRQSPWRTKSCSPRKAQRQDLAQAVPGQNKWQSVIFVVDRETGRN